jgi:hypothetical protein
MNMLALSGMRELKVGFPNGLFDSCALCLFLLGGVLLAVGLYHLSKPSFAPVRYLRRR